MSVQINDASLANIRTKVKNNEVTPGEFFEKLCDRIDTFDDELRSFVDESDRRTRLRTETDELKSRFQDRNDRPPLFGIPVGVKDIIHVDGFETRAGTAVPPELFAGPEASCVSRLRDAGAIVLGKTVTTEFAGAAPGLTRNPHNLDHTPGGSSSGSAAAVAAGLCPLALGTQTGGSVIRPAAFCGIVGMKPSFKRIPRDGVIERSVSADHVGMYTQDVPSMQIAAAVLCNDWEETAPIDGKLPTLGVPEGNYLGKATEEGLDAFEQHLTRLENAGCTIRRVTVPTFEKFDSLDERHQRLTDAELAMVHEEWYDDYRAFYRTPMAEHIESGREITTGQLAKGRASRLELRHELETLRDDHDLDLWTAPSARGPAPETIRSTGSAIMNRPWTHSGLPVISLPIGKSDNGLPMGIKYIGSFDGDEELLAWANLMSELI